MTKIANATNLTENVATTTADCVPPWIYKKSSIRGQLSSLIRTERFHILLANSSANARLMMTSTGSQRHASAILWRKAESSLFRRIWYFSVRVLVRRCLFAEQYSSPYALGLRAWCARKNDFFSLHPDVVQRLHVDFHVPQTTSTSPPKTHRNVISPDSWCRQPNLNHVSASPMG